MLQTLFVVFVFVFATIQCCPQTLECNVVNADTGEPLAFVNVGVVGKDVGTVTNETGTCKIALVDSLYNDSLKFSMLGYSPVAFLVRDFVQRAEHDNGLVELKPTSYALREVKVKPRKTKTRVLGRQTESRYVQAGFKSNQLGCEAGVLVNVKKGSVAFVKSFSASVSNNEYDTLFFRLNIYSLKDGMPHENILPHNVILRSTVKSGVIHANLESYNIVLEEDAVVSLEWIKDLGGTNGLFFSAVLGGGPVYYRHTSHGNWQKERMAGLGFWLTVEQETL